MKNSNCSRADRDKNDWKIKIEKMHDTIHTTTIACHSHPLSSSYCYTTTVTKKAQSCERMRIQVFIPKHSSALENLPQSSCQDVNGEKDNRHGQCTWLIYVHRERAMWTIFEPLFGKQCDMSSESNWKSKAETLLDVLIGRISPHLDENYHSSRCDSHFHLTNVDKNADDHQIDDTFDNKWSETQFHRKSKSIPRMKSKLKTINFKIQVSLLQIYIIPNNHPNMRPERIFTSSLVKLENFQIQLQSLNAYVATMGGGYFLCHYLSTAICLARYQRCIAFKLGDYNLALKCTVNEAYNYIYAGMIKRAFETIGQVEDLVQKRKNMISHSDGSEEDVIISMCKAAKLLATYMKTTEEGNISNKESCTVKNHLKQNAIKDTVSATHDDFQRMRVVKVKYVTDNTKVL